MVLVWVGVLLPAWPRSGTGRCTETLSLERTPPGALPAPTPMLLPAQGRGLLGPRKTLQQMA